MTILIFESTRHVPLPVLLAAALGAAAVAAGLFRALNDRLSLDVFVAPLGGRFWTLAGASAVAAFVYAALAPFRPARVFGIWYWPVRLDEALALRYAGALAALGALAFWTASRRGLAGSLDRWLPPPPSSAWLRLAGAGALAGCGTAIVGLYAGRALFLADALRRMGLPTAGGLLTLSLPALFLATGALLVALLLMKTFVPRALATATVAMAAWIAPVELGEAYLLMFWDSGAPSLSAAARVPRASEAETVAIVVLAAPDGSPGSQVRKVRLSAEGVDVSQSSLRSLGRYLRGHRYKTLFLGEALRALRVGWALSWMPDEHLDAAMTRAGPSFPPDYEGFLAAVRVAPATPENYERLERMARAAARARFPRVRQAQKIYEGFSAAYARFGDQERSDAWLGRIRGLWPLYDDDIHVEPIAETRDGSVAGRLLFNGRPAPGIRVGLFAIPSTTTVIAAYDGLVASAYPGPGGRFEFASLLPGAYYLALQADPVILGEQDLLFLHSPGVIRLDHDRMRAELFPIDILRRGLPPLPAPAAAPPGGLLKPIGRR
ncbi:MAG: hypothetical protein ABII00_16645 [Elusimicrobiota bacterium]